MLLPQGQALRAQLQPGTIPLATATPQTEETAATVNRVLARINKPIGPRAEELCARVTPSHSIEWQVPAEARKTRAAFTRANSKIQPDQTGHLTVTMAILRELGEEIAAAWMNGQRLASLLGFAARDEVRNHAGKLMNPNGAGQTQGLRRQGAHRVGLTFKNAPNRTPRFFF